jgi:hypothetical protein
MTLQFIGSLLGLAAFLYGAHLVCGLVDRGVKYLLKTRVSVRAPGTKVVYISKRRPLIDEMADRARWNVISGTRGRQ